MSNITLVSEDDMISPKKRDRNIDKDIDKGDIRRTTVSRKKTEKPIRILRLRYYQKMSLRCAQEDGDIGKKEVFAVDRSLEDLLKSLYYNTGIQGMVVMAGCISVEKDDRMSCNDKFIFIEIDRNDFGILKRQLDNHVTIAAYNKGEFSILDGKRSSLYETFDIPRIWRGGRDEKYGMDGKDEDGERHISDTNVIMMRERLREELKELGMYHSYSDEQIDTMKENELIRLKRFSKRKMFIEQEKIKNIKKLLG